MGMILLRTVEAWAPPCEMVPILVSFPSGCWEEIIVPQGCAYNGR